MFEIVGKTNIDFMGKRRIAFGISGVLIALGVLAVIQIMLGSANLGIDFFRWYGSAVKVRQTVAN